MKDTLAPPSSKRPTRAYGYECKPELALRTEPESELSRAAHSLGAAAETAFRRGSYSSAIESLQRGLALLAKAGATPSRLRLELDLQAALAAALATMEGHGSPAVRQVNERVLQLADVLNDTPLSALFGAWMSLFAQAKYVLAAELASQLALRAARRGEQQLAAGTSVMAGLCSLYRGRVRVARQQLEFGLRSLGDEPRTFEAMFNALDPFVVGHDISWALWSEGSPDTALSLVRRGLASPRINERPYFVAHLTYLTAVLHELRGEHAEALRQATTLQVLCEEHEFAFLTRLARYQQAVQRSYLGQPSAVNEMERWISSFRNSGSKVAATRAQAVLAEALIAAGRFERAALALTTGFELVLANDEHFWESELHRLQGEVWLHLERAGKSAFGCDLGTSRATSAEACMLKSLHVARKQGSVSLELRAAMSIGRFLQDGPRRDEARSLLARVYEQFFEGFESPELIAAGALMRQLELRRS